MKKLKLKNLSAIGNVLTSEELKHVYGGAGSGSGGSGYQCTIMYDIANLPYPPTTGMETIIVASKQECKDKCFRKCYYDYDFSDCEAVFNNTEQVDCYAP